MATKTAAKAASSAKVAASTKSTKAVTAKVGGTVIERKALAADNKSEGMRMLFDAGYTVVQVRQVFHAPYGYVYGVAQRHGVAMTAASRKVARATKPAAKRARATAKAPIAKVTRVATGGRPVGRPKGSAQSATSRVAAKLAAKAAVKPGRPSPTRRAANRKSTRTA